MNTAQTLAAAHDARPDLLEKVATAVALLGVIDTDYEQELVQEIRQIVEYATEKTAAADFNQFGMALGGTLLAGLGASMATDLYDAAKRGLTKGRNFQRVMEANPELKQFDKKVLKSSFDTLHRYTPEFTADPILGGALMGAIVASPANAVSIVKDFTNARKNLIDAKHRQYSPSNLGIERFEDRHGDAMKLEQLRHSLSSDRELAADTRRHGLAGEMETVKDRNAINRDIAADTRRHESAMAAETRRAEMALKHQDMVARHQENLEAFKGDVRLRTSFGGEAHDFERFKATLRPPTVKKS